MMGLPKDYVAEVAMDECHMACLAGLVRAQKPRSVLEVGYGSGLLTERLLEAVRANGARAKYCLVDNWMDFGGSMPLGLEQALGIGVKVVTSEESAFVTDAVAAGLRWDFIVMDGDHRRTQEWAPEVYAKLLNPRGILVYHDVTNVVMFPMLLDLYAWVVRAGIPHTLFTNRSLPTERCDRGLLVIFKPEGL